MIGSDPASAARATWDLVVVGGGIHGVCTALEASRRGLRALLLERSDFGGETSWNSLRILHGGLRYLQTFDLQRFRESVGERTWFLRHFPDLVEPIPCLMPLYGDGLRRRTVFSVALAANDALSARWNRTLPAAGRLPAGRALDAPATRELFPDVRTEGLRGGALWHDARMPGSSRLLMELLRAACAGGAGAINRCEVSSVLVEAGAVRGVSAVDGRTGTVWRFSAPVVVNCAGPWARGIARDAHRDFAELFRPSLGFNLLLDRPHPGGIAVAVSAPRPGARTYFLVPWKGRVLAGTFHDPLDGGDGGVSASPGEGRIDRFLEDLAEAAPALRAGRAEILRVLPGLMPVSRDGSVEVATRDVFVDHGKRGGPRGLYSVSGVKWTTARRAAERTLSWIFRFRPAAPFVRTGGERPFRWRDFAGLAARDRSAARDVAARLVREESVDTFEDLVLRRTDWGVIPAEGEEARHLLASLLGSEAPP